MPEIHCVVTTLESWPLPTPRLAQRSRAERRSRRGGVVVLFPCGRAAAVFFRSVLFTQINVVRRVVIEHTNVLSLFFSVPGVAGAFGLGKSCLCIGFETSLA